MSKGLWDLAFMHLIFPVNKMYFFHHFYPFTVPWCLLISPEYPMIPNIIYPAIPFFPISVLYKLCYFCPP